MSSLEQRRTFTLAEWKVLAGVLLVVVGSWLMLGSWMKTFDFRALRQNGIKTTAKIAHKLPYKSTCPELGRRPCREYILVFYYFKNGVQQRVEIGVSKAEYEKANLGDQEIIYYLPNQTDFATQKHLESHTPWPSTGFGLLACLWAIRLIVPNLKRI